jgi:basic membrane protein A and related proteins
LKEKEPLYIPRRLVIRGIIASTAFGITSQLWTGCTPSETPTVGTSPTSPTAPELTIGFIFVGPKDDLAIISHISKVKE